MTAGLTSRARHWLCRRIRDENGTATIPFVIFVPFLMLLVMSTLETGTLMLRHVMLERALDLSVRDLRLGSFANPDHDAFKRLVCNRAGIIPDCMNTLAIELRPVDMTNWVIAGSGATCVDRSEPLNPVATTFDLGHGDELMLVRACAKVSPIFPNSGLGFRLAKDAHGDYSLVSASAFVNEPTPGSG